MKEVYLKDLEIQWNDHFHMRDQTWKVLTYTAVFFVGIVGLEMQGANDFVINRNKEGVPVFDPLSASFVPLSPTPLPGGEGLGERALHLVSSICTQLHEYAVAKVMILFVRPALVPTLQRGNAILSAPAD